MTQANRKQIRVLTMPGYTGYKLLSLFLSMSLSMFFSLSFFILQPIGTLACSTCGCSELCPIAMMKDSEESKNAASLSDSLWGNIILKMAYQKDPQIQKLSKHLKGVATLTGGTVAGAVGGTLAQNIISASVLNPPDGLNDNYLPGSLGLGLSGIVNIAFDGGMLINWRLKKKMKARQLIVRGKVEEILNHLEFSETACPQAQTELSAIIGKRAAGDCMQLWRSSHATAFAAKEKNLSSIPNVSPTVSSLSPIVGSENPIVSPTL